MAVFEEQKFNKIKRYTGLPDGMEERLNHLFKGAGLKYEQVADCIGCNRTHMYDWLSGGGMNVAYLKRICEVFNISADWLLFGEERSNGGLDGRGAGKD